MPTPPEQQHLQALFDAYVAASGRVLTLSYERKKALREFDRRGFSPRDVEAVIGELQRRIRKGVRGYDETSLDWGNAMGNVDRFEDRLALLREAAKRRAAKPTTAPATAAPSPSNEGKILGPDATPEERAEVREKAKQLSAELKRKLYGGAA